MPLAVAAAALIFAPSLSFPVPDAVFHRLLGEHLPSQVRVQGVRWKPFFGQRFFVDTISLSADSLRSLPGLGSGLGIDEAAFLFRETAFRLDPSGPGGRLRILKMRSPFLELRGGLYWEEGRVRKAGIAAFFPAAWAERLPGHWAQRLSSASGGRKILKCAYKDHRLTFYGRSGPLMQAAWSPD